MPKHAKLLVCYFYLVHFTYKSKGCECVVPMVFTAKHTKEAVW